MTFDGNLYRNNSDHPMLQNLDPDDNFFNEVYSGLTTDSASMYYSIDKFNTRFNNNRSYINITLFNTRSFKKNGEIVTSVLKSFNRTPDVIVLSETWGISGEHDALCIDGYNSYHTTRQGRRSGGVSVYANCNMQLKQIVELSVCNPTIETCVAELCAHSENIVVFAVYRPHSDSIDNFSQQLEQMLQSPILDNKQIILLGDINIDLIKHSTQPVSEFINTMQSLSFIPIITKPTRFPPAGSRGEPSLLDHIWVNSLKEYSSGVLCVDVTDHCPVFVNVPIVHKENNKTKITFRTHSPHSIEKFKRDVYESVRTMNFDADVNVLTSKFSEKLNTLYSACFPIKIKYVLNRRLCKPWLSPAIMKSIKTKSQYFKLYKLGIISAELNRRYRNKLTSTIRAAKRLYYHRAFTNNCNDIKKTWRLIKKALCKTTNTGNIKSLLVNNNTINDYNEIAEYFCEYFSNIANSLDSLIPQSNSSPLIHVTENTQASIFFSPVTGHDVSRIIGDLKNTKGDIKTIPIRILKHIKDIVADPLSIIINKSLESGVFPESLKKANVIPIFKSGDPQIASNYRPIAILPYLSKIFEKCVSNKLMNFLTKFQILSSNQFGFLKGKSTVDAFNALTHFIYESLNRKQHCMGIFIDLKKAFDTVNHGVLLKKLELCGVRGLPLTWFTSYLRDRRQSVRVAGHSSSVRVVNVGVPQGSILGPILFLIYINDLPRISNLFSSILYADDTTLLSKNSDYGELIDSINSEIPRLYEWTNANRLSLNLNKTYAMLYSNLADSDLSLKIMFQGTAIKFKTHEEFLGMIIDSGLRFSEHIRFICNKLSKSAGILYRLREFVPQQILTSLYYSLIYPYLIYGNLVWGGTFSQHLKPLKLLQKKLIRIITNSEYLAHTNPLFRQTNILKIDDLHKFILVQYMHKVRETEPAVFDRHHSYYTRYRNDAQASLNRLTLTQHSVSFAGPHAWNELPSDIRNSVDLQQFKRRVKMYYISKYV